MGKLLFFDVDQTLYSERDICVPESARRALKMAQEQGHRIFLNTGRPYGFIGDDLKALDFDGYVLSNGNDIRYGNERLFYSVIPEEICGMLKEAAERHHVKGCLESADICSYYDDDRHFHPHQDNMIKIYETDGTMPFQFGWDKVQTFEKLVAFGKCPEDIEKFLDEIRTLPYAFTCIKNDPCFYEIIPKGRDKGTGLVFMADWLGVSLDDCYVFGDAPNDLPMFHVGAHNVAMGNSYDVVKKEAEYVTTDIDKDGIWNAFCHYGFLPKEK